MSIDTKALTALLGEKNAEAERIAGTFSTDEKGRFSIAPEQYADYKRAVAEATEVKGLLDAATAHADMTAYLAAPAGTSEAASDAAARGGVEFKSLGDVFIGSQDFAAAQAEGFRRPNGMRAELEGKSIFSLSGGSVEHQALGTIQNLGIAEQARRKWHVRDLFPKSTTKAAVLYGVREIGWVNNAAQVRERYAANGVDLPTGGPTDVYGRSPKSSIQLTSVLYPVAEVSHTLDAHKNILADEPRLKTFLNTRMVEGVKYREDYDLLHSVGDGERLTGLFNTPGIGEYTGLAADKHSVQVRRAITKALLAEYDPTGLVVSPTMWEQIEVEEDDHGAFRVAVAVAIGAEKRVWRLNVVETTAMADEQFLVGAFGMGAQLHDRESVSVTVSTENSRNFEDGVITFRADERVALEVPRPESFVVGTWTDPV